ncbi:MAG: hypothetical protein KC615_08365, partial [Anaerolineae bacterium]|nr:hypothetical protein [Anaerolineae bacterium]
MLLFSGAFTINTLPPLTNRKPATLATADQRRLLGQAHPGDGSDPFASDPNPDIQLNGRLALRNDNAVDYYFLLGDLCAKLVFSDDHRLRIFYAGKTLLAYQRAQGAANSDIDRAMAANALDKFAQWTLDM